MPSTGHKPGPDSTHHVPALSFLLSNGKKRVLIDTGMPSTREALEHRISTAQPRGFGIVARLAHLGLSPKHISAIVLTHLHWDHCAYMTQFEGIPKLVQKKEADFANRPPAAYRLSYRRAGHVLNDPATQLIDQEFRLNSDILLFCTPGHTPGHQSVGVHTDTGLVVIAGDAAWPGGTGLFPPRKAVDSQAAGKSFRQLFHFGSRILASHDPRVLAFGV